MKRTEWLKWRQKGLGGSDIAGILGLSPWTTPFGVYFDKVTPVEDQVDDDDKAKRRGRLLERAVGDWMAGELERDLDLGQLIVHPDHDWARASVSSRFSFLSNWLGYK